MAPKSLRWWAVVLFSFSAWGAASAANPKTDSMRYNGRVEAAEQAGIAARVAGTVDRVTVDIGDRVKKGQLLIELSAPELKDDLDLAVARLEQAKAEVKQAEAAVQEAEARAKTSDAARGAFVAELARARAGVDVARAGVEIAKAGVRRAQTEVEYTTIKSPFDGVVVRRTVDVGDTVGPPTQGVSVPLVSVMRDDVVHIVFDLDERSAARVAVGTPAVVHAPSLGDANFSGKMTRIGGAFNPLTGTVRAEVDLPNADGKLRPGMYVSVDVTEDHPGK